MISLKRKLILKAEKIFFKQFCSCNCFLKKKDDLSQNNKGKGFEFDSFNANYRLFVGLIDFERYLKVFLGKQIVSYRFIF